MLDGYPATRSREGIEKTQQIGYLKVAGTLFHMGKIRVFIAAEDHPPPHVHAEHTGEGWVARYRFSFLSDVAGLYRFSRKGHRPTPATLATVRDGIVANIGLCRAEWWATQGSKAGIGLVNRRVETKKLPGGGIRARVPLQPGKAAALILSASYDETAREVLLSLQSHPLLRLQCGQHIEEAEEWS